MNDEEIGVIVRDDRPGRHWFSIVGARDAIDLQFDWLTFVFPPQNDGWFALISHFDDAVFLDVHIFHDVLKEIFEAHFHNDYVAPTLPPEPLDARRPLIASPDH